MSNLFHSSLKDRVVLITGGTAGFGWFIAEKLLAGGAKIAITGTRPPEERGDLIAKAEAIAEPGHCVAIQADVRDWDDCQRTVEETLNAFGQVDVLINNAGRGSREYRIDYQGGNTTKFWDVPVEAWHSVIDTNLTGSFLMTKATVPHMIERKFGKVFSISTSLTTMIGNGLSPYGASKSGLETAHIVWARELAEHNVDVNILLPGGASDTGFIPETMVPGDVGTRGDKILPGDVIVPPAVWMCTDETNGLTGRRVIAKLWDQDIDAATAFAGCLQSQHDHPEIM
ncbi:MAG: SDR family NAD(P)-dependent oxidoreductase [Rhodospirillaceae bacterium]|nr:SDR family NAD(P)-dependent oxidoreductase [Rhodospirillaceae bacterium]